MKLSLLKLLMLCAVFAAAVSHAEDSSLGGHADRNAAKPGVIERWSDRALARMQSWISRARNKITGHSDDSMQGCDDMMGGGMGMMQDGGGMMGNMHSARPNEQWLKPAQQP